MSGEWGARRTWLGIPELRSTNGRACYRSIISGSRIPRVRIASRQASNNFYVVYCGVTYVEMRIRGEFGGRKLVDVAFILFHTRVSRFHGRE